MDEWIKQLCVRAAVAGLYAVNEREARAAGERIAAAAMRERLVGQEAVETKPLPVMNRREVYRY